MNRRGFFAALAALPALLRAKVPLPPPAPMPMPVALSGLSAWIPPTPPSDDFSGIDRQVDPHFRYTEGRPMTREALIEAANRLWTLRGAA